MKLFSLGFRRGIGPMIGLLAVLAIAPASAQENLDQGKTPAQLFASDCAICHKTVQGLSKGGGPFGLGLEGFLREHYTASRESAAALARYVATMDTGPAAPDKRARRSAKGSEKPKGDRKKPAEAKSGDGKSGEAKPAEAKPAEAKPADGKPADSKPETAKTDAKPEAKPETKTETKPAESKSSEARAAEPKSGDPKPADAKPADAAKPDKPEKSD